MNTYDETKTRWALARELIHECPWNDDLRTSLWLDHHDGAGTHIYKLWERRNAAPGWSSIGLLDEQMIALAARLQAIGA